MRVGTTKCLVKKVLAFGRKHFHWIKKWTPHPFVKPSGLTSGAFVRGKVGLIFVRKCFKYFNFYSIEKISSTGPYDLMMWQRLYFFGTNILGTLG